MMQKRSNNLRKKILSNKFFDRSALIVARKLIGKFLVQKIGRKTYAYMITETEAYHGFNDLASHARSGKTARNAPMYAQAGVIYVYFTYGMHWMLNLVCGKKEYPAAVLIRGAGGIAGPAPTPTSASQKVPYWYAQRKIARDEKYIDAEQFGFAKGTMLKLVSGPARLTKKLRIDRELNSLMLGKKSGLWVEDREVVISPRQIRRTPRIGIGNAGKLWAGKLWRFVLIKPPPP